jgi:signal transduction histidine kinase/ActR/RegA family two-component response regulator
MVQFDRNGKIAMLNPAFACLAMPMLPEGKTFDNFIVLLTPFLPNLRSILQSSDAPGTVCQDVCVHLPPFGPGGAPRILSLWIMRMDDDRHVAVLSDLTERRRLELEREQREAELRTANANLERLAQNYARAREAAEQANRAKSRFLAGMSHELRTPLNCILGYAELLRIDGDLTAIQRARVEAMKAAGTHLLEMIHCVLDFSEIETERAALRIVEVDPRKVVQACIDLMLPMAAAKGLALNLVIAPAIPAHILSDPTRLRQILLNLVGNAVKFTSAGLVELRLRITGRGRSIRFDVADTGPGVPVEQRQRLFQEFERLDTEATRAAEGAGLGLFLSKQLATLMNGRIAFDANPAGGSIFSLELPLADPVYDESDAHAEPDAQRGLRVLVVDDVEMNCEIAAAFIRSGGHDVTCANGGAEAVAAALARDFDIIMMDVRMPGIDGLEATRQIRRIPGPRGRVPIVALTAQVFTEQVEACWAAGMNDHLAKPFTPQDLLDCVVRVAAADSSGL